VHGRKAYEEHIDRQLQLAHAFTKWIEQSEHFELAGPTMLTIVNFRVKRAGRNAEQIAAAHLEIVERITGDGQRWISDTVVNGASVLRMMITSYLTEARHLLGLQSALEEAARLVERGARRRG
jgi:glutamate/tyrosine decarboxylase-like PLP-dependent enzyme